MGSKPYTADEVQEIKPRMQLRRKQPKIKVGGDQIDTEIASSSTRNQRYRKMDNHPPTKLSILRSWCVPENYSLNQTRVKPEQFFNIK